MPPRDRFINVGTLSSDIAGQDFERSLQNLSKSLLSNRQLEEQKRQALSRENLANTAVELRARESRDARSFLQDQGVKIGENVQLPDAILNSLASTVFTQKNKLATTKAQQEGAVGFQEKVKQGRENLLKPLSSPGGRVDPRLDVPTQLDNFIDPNLQADPTPRLELTPEEDLQNFLDTKASFIQSGGDARAFETKSVIAQEKALRDAVLDKRKQAQKRFAPPKITGSLVNELRRFNGDPNNPGDVDSALKRMFSDQLQLAVSRGVGVAEANRQAQLNSPMKQSDLKNVVRKDGSAFPFGTTPLQAIEEGAIALTPTMKEKLNKLEDVDTVLNTLLTPDEGSGKILELFTSEKLMNRAKDIPRNLMAKFLDVNIDDDAKTANFKGNLRSYENFRSTLPSLMVRSLGEVGTLTDRDIERAQSFFPPVFGSFGIPTSQSTAIQSVRDLRSLITEIRNRKKGDFGIISDEKIIRKESDLPQNMRTTKQKVSGFIKDFGGIPEN